jgi:D-serine deaminase-like pyridoxal phosphate-dependent protein
MDLVTIKTPALLLDLKRVERNAENMLQRVKTWGVKLRPHIKTHKCIEVVRLQLGGVHQGITVSTLAEAQAFVKHGFRDITYGVPLEPGKFAEVIDLARHCEHFGLITDDLNIPDQLNTAARSAGIKLDLYLKVDSGYHRCGVEPHLPLAKEIPRRISELSHLNFAGILTHAGHSYHASSSEELLEIARQERDLMKEFAATLREEGVVIPVISIGSTPTITQIDQLEGIDEVRPGNYIFFDAFQATLGSCAFTDCALTVVTAIVHCDRSRGKVVVDAGAIALSKDRGAVERDPHCGYGRVLDLAGNELGLRVDSLSQEHGLIKVDDDDLWQDLRVGKRLRILANHSCLTAAQHSHFNVLEGECIVERWPIIQGW